MSDKVIDVYLGFMDEEVNTVLNGLLDKEMQKGVAARRPIVMIERGHVDPAGPLLEWPISRYKTGIKAVKYAGAQLAGQAGVDASVEGVLARAISVFLQQDDAAEAQLRQANIGVLRAIDVHALLSQKSGAKLKVALTGDGPQLSVVRFNVGDTDTTLPPIVVFRAPEMGLQPNLMSPYMEFILMMISALSSQLAHAAAENEEWPLRITSFGAQGGASSSKSPGTMSYICASLYVGYEYSNGVASPSIALCSQGGVYTFKSGSAPEPDKLKDFFVGQRDALVVDTISTDPRYLRQEEAFIKAGMKLKDVIAQLIKNYGASSSVQPEVSGTSPWFISADQKDAFAAVGITGCNMEDYWVLRTMRRCALERAIGDPGSRSMYPVFVRGFVSRVNADPLHIEAPVAAAFQLDLRAKQLTRQNYADLLLWGLQGLPLAAQGVASMPAVARWTFADAPIFQNDPGAFARHLYGLLVQGTNDVIVPDPFFIEIATDLLKECANLPASSGGVFAHAPAADVLVALAEAATLALRSWTAANRQPSHDVAAALLAFVNVLADRAGFAIGGTNMKVWLRPGGKWQGIESNSIQDVPPGTTFSDAAVDRAFYKSSNLLALQARTAGVLH
jgi:hypothetical protein